MNTTWKKQDLFLFGIILLIAVLCFTVYLLYPRKGGAFVKVVVDGKTKQTFPLDEDKTYLIKTKDQKNTLQIKNGFASIIKANCPDKLCVHQRKISKQGETLVCLPHKVIISVSDSKNDSSGTSFDGIVK